MCQKFSNYYKINLYQEYPIAKSGLNRKSKDSTLRHGFIAFYIDNTYKRNAKEQLEKQINNIFDQAKDFVSSKNLKIEYHIHKNHPFSEDDNNVYGYVVFLIKK